MSVQNETSITGNELYIVTLTGEKNYSTDYYGVFSNFRKAQKMLVDLCQKKTKVPLEIKDGGIYDIDGNHLYTFVSNIDKLHPMGLGCFIGDYAVNIEPVAYNPNNNVLQSADDPRFYVVTKTGTSPFLGD